MLDAVVAETAAAMRRTGNASSLHGSGRRARRAVEEGRERIAAALGARPSEVVFTTGGTEGDNLAVKGLYWSRRDADPARTRVLVSAVEHHAVLDAAEWLAAHEGAEVELLPVDAAGRVRPEVLAAAIERAPERVALASVMWANNEVGTVNPVRELAAVAHAADIPFHTDAVQAVGILPVDFAASGVDALVFTGHKLGGPYGVGALLLGRTVELAPLLHGGGQERDVRSGHPRHPRRRRAGHRGRDGRRGRAAAQRAAHRAARRPGGAGARHRPGRPAQRRSRHRRDRRRPVPAARQRAPVVPRLRGRQPAHAARRAGHRVLHRLGLHGGGGAAQPRADRDGRRRGGRARLAAVLARAHLHPGRCGRRRGA